MGVCNLRSAPFPPTSVPFFVYVLRFKKLASLFFSVAQQKSLPLSFPSIAGCRRAHQKRASYPTLFQTNRPLFLRTKSAPFPRKAPLAPQRTSFVGCLVQVFFFPYSSHVALKTDGNAAVWIFLHVFPPFPFLQIYHSRDPLPNQFFFPHPIFILLRPFAFPHHLG